MCKRMAELREAYGVRGACSRFRIAQLCSKRQQAAHPSPEKRLLGIPKSAKRRNAPHSPAVRDFAAVAGYSEVAKPLECAVFRRFRRTASRVAASLAGWLTDPLQAWRVQVPSRSFSG